MTFKDLKLQLSRLQLSKDRILGEQIITIRIILLIYVIWNNSSSNVGDVCIILHLSCPQKENWKMPNASSTFIGIIIGALIGGIITWWVYRMQNKTSEKQETVIENIDKMVKKMERQGEKHRAHQDEVLNKILSLDSKINSILEKKDK